MPSAANVSLASSLALGLDRGSREPLQVQLYGQVRSLILAGRLPTGTRLPSTRGLAAELGVSRTTTLAAYDQLVSEGYVEGRTGAGAYVAAELPDIAPLPTLAPSNPVEAPLRLSRRGNRFAADPAPRPAPGRPFDSSAPDAATFPFEDWSRCLSRAWRHPNTAAMHERSPGGYPPLRAAIAEHLRVVRGLSITASQIIITNGLRESLSLLMSTLTDPGDAVWIEDPGYRAAPRAITAFGGRPVPIPVDGQGLSVDAGQAMEPDARVALVTPSRQYPLGMTMSLARRLALLDWARQADAWIVEDDYDSEYRYAGRPLAALASLDTEGRVIYVGSFSRSMFPSLRLSYMAVPARLAPAILHAQAAIGSQSSAIPQLALAEFIESGQFAAHVRRMRRLYGRRLAHFQGVFERHFKGLLEPLPSDAGMHVTALLSPSLITRMDDVTASQRAAEAGITATPLSQHYADAANLQGLLLGFACVPEAAQDAAAVQLTAALNAI